VKKRKVLLIIGLAILLAGCNAKGSVDQKLTANFPDSYQREFDKLSFNCNLEIPEGFIASKQFKSEVLGQSYINSDKVLAEYINDKEVIEKHEIPGDEKGMPDSVDYLMRDGSHVFLGYLFTYGTENSQYYSRIGATMEEYRINHTEDSVDFTTPETCIEKLDEILKWLGCPVEELQYEAYPLNAETMEVEEAQQIQMGYIPENKKKPGWSKEDDAYLITAYQYNNELPIFHERMSVFSKFAFDTADNAPVWAVYSNRGLEIMSVSNIYQVSDTDEPIVFMEFEEIAKVLVDKYDSIIDDSTYEVTRAKLFNMIRRNQNQEYISEPVWYFESLKDGEKPSVVIVNATTGKEIFLP